MVAAACLSRLGETIGEEDSVRYGVSMPNFGVGVDARAIAELASVCALHYGGIERGTGPAYERSEHEPGSHCDCFGLGDRAGVGEGTGGERLRPRHHLSYGRSRGTGDP